MRIQPAAPLASPLTGSADKGLPSRSFATTESISVVLDARGDTGTVSVDVPLDSFQPPLSPELLRSLSARVIMPPNGSASTPVTLVEKDGRPHLRVTARAAEVGFLTRSPLSFMVGEAASISGTAAVPRLIAQISTRTISVDGSLPSLELQKRGRAQQLEFVAGLQRDRAGMVDGTSSWFGSRQLADEVAQHTARLEAATAAAAPLVSSLEQVFAQAPEALLARTLPESHPASGPLRTAAKDMQQLSSALANAQHRLSELKQVRTEVQDVPLALAEVEAELGALERELAPLQQQTAATQAALRSQLTGLYAELRSSSPDTADYWLRNLATASGHPAAQALTTATHALFAARSTLEQSSRDLARTTANTAAHREPRIAALTTQITDARASLAELDRELAGLAAGTRKVMETASTTYDPALSII